MKKPNLKFQIGTSSSDSCGGSRLGCNGETEAHARLKRLAMIWAQQNGYSACAMEVSLPRCRYRADVVAYRPSKSTASPVEDSPWRGRPLGTTAVFECKQCLVDLRRDNGCAATTRARLEKLHARREVLERNLRVHYPALRVHDSLFDEFDSHNFEAIDHRGYKQVVRQTRAFQNRLFDCTKFETLVRYCCANLFYIVLPKELFHESEVPIGWGALIESNAGLDLVRKPTWHDVAADQNLRMLERIAIKGTRIVAKSL